MFDAILYLLRTGCQWRQLPADFPPWPKVHSYFRRWRIAGFWTHAWRRQRIEQEETV